jgi:hypothetical protein
VLLPFENIQICLNRRSVVEGAGQLAAKGPQIDEHLVTAVDIRPRHIEINRVIALIQTLLERRVVLVRISCL